MSLTKTLQQRTGFDASYWQIAKMEVEPRQKTIGLTISGWKDKAAYDAGLAPMGRYRTFINQEVLSEQSNTTFIPALKSTLQEAQDICKILVSDLSDSTADGVDVI